MEKSSFQQQQQQTQIFLGLNNYYILLKNNQFLQSRKKEIDHMKLYFMFKNKFFTSTHSTHFTNKHRFISVSALSKICRHLYERVNL